MTSPTWFDRLTRYRVAAAFLYIPFLLTLVGQIIGYNLSDWITAWGVRAFYYTGLLLLTLALVMDSWEVYAGKRRVKQLIDQRQTDRRARGKHAKTD